MDKIWILYLNIGFLHVQLPLFLLKAIIIDMTPDFWNTKTKN